MSNPQRELDQLLLSRWERRWLDPDWDSARGYAKQERTRDREERTEKEKTG